MEPMDQITLGEAIRRLESIENKIDRVDDRYLPREVYDADRVAQRDRNDTHQRRLDRLESGHTWLMRSLAMLAFAIVLQVAVQVMSA